MPLKYEMWELLRHEKFPETHVLAILLTGNALLFMEKKDILHIKYQRVISEFPDFLEVYVAQVKGKFTLNLCDAQVFETNYSEISC